LRGSATGDDGRCRVAADHLLKHVLRPKFAAREEKTVLRIRNGELVVVAEPRVSPTADHVVQDGVRRRNALPRERHVVAVRLTAVGLGQEGQRVESAKATWEGIVGDRD